MILSFFSAAGWESWDVERRPLIPLRMPVLFDEDLRFEDGPGAPRPATVANRWLRELPAEFGEPELKAFAAAGRRSAEALATALAGLETDLRIVLTHYAPVSDTLTGEPRDLYPMLGNHQLGQVIDRAGGVALAVHGHAHHGSEHGSTPGGVPVRNVAQHVLGAPYRVYTLARHRTGWRLDQPEPADQTTGNP